MRKGFRKGSISKITAVCLTLTIMFSAFIPASVFAEEVAVSPDNKSEGSNAQGEAGDGEKPGGYSDSFAAGADESGEDTSDEESGAENGGGNGEADDTDGGGSTQVDTDVKASLVEAKSGILIEPETGEVLYEYNPDERLQIASVTKVMTMLLIMEALDNGKINLSDMVTVSENAASMGGSQVYLETGEQMSVEDMLKAIAVASGNDAAVAMAEHISGSTEAFVEQMNRKAAELGCENTHFCNCNGLDEPDDHYSSARDIAKISAELLKHEDILKYTTIWMDTLRDGSFGLSNTNKLIRSYNGAIGIKTGSTSKALYCLSAAAERDGMRLIAVVLGAPSTADRFSSASKLLDYGFANYWRADAETAEGESEPGSVRVRGGEAENVALKLGEDESGFIVKKENKDKVEVEYELPEEIAAPVEAGQTVGKAVFKIDGETAHVCDIVAAEAVDKINAIEMFVKVLNKWIGLHAS